MEQGDYGRKEIDTNNEQEVSDMFSTIGDISFEDKIFKNIMSQIYGENNDTRTVEDNSTVETTQREIFSQISLPGLVQSLGSPIGESINVQGEENGSRGENELEKYTLAEYIQLGFNEDKFNSKNGTRDIAKHILRRNLPSDVIKRFIKESEKEKSSRNGNESQVALSKLMRLINVHKLKFIELRCEAQNTNEEYSIEIQLDDQLISKYSQGDFIQLGLTEDILSESDIENNKVKIEAMVSHFYKSVKEDTSNPDENKAFKKFRRDMKIFYESEEGQSKEASVRKLVFKMIEAYKLKQETPLKNPIEIKRFNKMQGQIKRRRRQ